MRKVARSSGFGIADQARISLAASSLAYALGLGQKNQGRIVIECLDERGRSGVRVICLKQNVSAGELPPGALDETRFMVDEMSVEDLPPKDLQVTLIKWKQQS